MSDHYLDCFDPQRVKARKRRMPDTATVSDRDKRHPAAVVKRALLERNKDMCAVPYCTNKIFLENSHRVAHAAGGAREAKDLDRICTLHHDMYHSGELRIEGTTENPVFLTRDGKPLDARSGLSPPPPPPT